MNMLKASVIVFASVILVTGCQKKEDVASLPPEQILTGNAILAPQSVTLEAHGVGMQVSPYNASMTAPMDSNSLELTSAPITDKPTSRDIQQALKNAGTYNGPIDGSIGPKTKKAIRDFQVQAGLSADGKVGPRTWKKLSSYLSGSSVEPTELMTISN